MSFEATAIVLNHSKAKGTTKLVLIGIASHEGDGGSWPSIATLARYANVHPRNVQHALRTLEQLGEIETELQAGGSKGGGVGIGPNRYRVTLRCPFECDRSSQHRTRDALLRFGIGADEQTGGGSATPGDSATPPLATAPPEGRRQRHPNLSLNQPGNPSSRTSAQSEPAPVDNHECDHGWLDEDDEGRRPPCLVCKPHLAKHTA